MIIIIIFTIFAIVLWAESEFNNNTIYFFILLFVYTSGVGAYLCSHGYFSILKSSSNLFQTTLSSSHSILVFSSFCQNNMSILHVSLSIFKY